MRAAASGRFEPEFDLADRWWASRIALRTLRLPAWQVGAIAFAGYYVLPMIFAAGEGVVASPRTAARQFDPVGFAGLGRWLSHSQSMADVARRGVAPLYYTGDLVHLAMAVITLFAGATLMVLALARFGGVFETLARGGQIDVPDAIVDAEVRKATSHCRNYWIQGCVVLLSILLGSFILLRALDPAYDWWWGHIRHGPAGLVFAFVAGIMVWEGATSVYLLAVGLHTISRLLLHPLRLRPLHPDRCNGFGQFGDYLILLFFLSIMIAGSVWTTLWGGYLGIETFIGTWVVGAGVTLAIPLILITPLMRCTLQISRARQARLNGIATLLDRVLLDIERGVVHAENARSLREEMQHLLDTQKAISEVYGSNNFPFKAKIAGSLSLGYMIQVGLIVKEAATKLTAP